MGNCIGKKPHTKSKRYRHSPPSPPLSTIKLRRNNQLNTKSILPTSLKSTSIDNHDSHLSDLKEFNIIERPLSLTSTVTKDQFVFVNTPTRLSSIALSTQCETFKLSNDVKDFNENNLSNPISLITNEEDTTMGNLCNKENETDKDKEISLFTQNLLPESIGTSPSPTLSDASLCSFSSQSTSFSSQDQLILSSSCSSSEINPILSSYKLVNHEKFQFVDYNEKDCLNNHSTNEIFPTVLPASLSRRQNDLFLSEFHKKTIIHDCKTLSSIIDDIAQQDFIRIHQKTRTVLIEHKQYECINLKDLKNYDTPRLIFDEDKSLVHLTKYIHPQEFESMAYNTSNVPKILSSCENCSLVLSGSKLANRLHSFLLVNSTYNLVKMCFYDINTNNHIFGYISQKHSNPIQQTIINNSKLNYSYDIDVDHTLYSIVLRLQSWSQEIRSMYEQRKRYWPLNIENLFNNTCFIEFNGNDEEIYTNSKCPTCEKQLYLLSNSSWSYTYAAIEAQLVNMMSDRQIRFASILWNYLNGKTKGQFPFVIFKHILFHFFEQYSSDSFITSDLFSHVHHFIDYLLNCLEKQSIPHYFNSNNNLYNENLSTIIINSITTKLTYSDFKNFSVYILPNTSLYLHHLIYLIQFQSNFLQYLRSSKTNLLSTIIETDEFVIQNLSQGIKTSRRQLDSTIAVKSHRPLTLDCLYHYQEENVQIILDYLPLLREKEPSLLIHSLWSIFIQYFNPLFDDLFNA